MGRIPSRPSLQPQLRNLTSIGGILGTGLLAIVGLFVWQQEQPLDDPLITYQEYFFQPIEDNQYENPANWYPAYPGTQLAADQRVTLEGLVNVPFYDLEVKGILHVSMGASLFSPKQTLSIGLGGKLINDGEILLHTLHTSGQINNNFTGKISCHFFENNETGETFNLQGSEIEVTQRLLNTGNFHNYGHCIAQDQFENKATFNQLGQATLFVRGEALQIASNRTQENLIP